MNENIAFCIDVFLHIGVPIQMVGSHVGDHRYVRRLLHIGQLKTGKLHHRKGLGLLQYQLGGGLTAQSQSQLHAVGEDIAEAGVVGADVAEGVLPQLADEVAEAALIEEGTPLVLGEDEAGRLCLPAPTA